MTSALDLFRTGLFAPWTGLRLISFDSSIRRAAIVPVVLTFLIMLAGVFLGFPTLSEIVVAIATYGVAWLGFADGTLISTAVHWLLLLLAWPAALFAFFYFLFLVSRILATPFYSFLAERVLLRRQIIADQPFELRDWILSNFRLAWIGLLKLVVFSMVGVGLFAISFVPGLSLLAGFGFLLLASFDATDFSFEVQRMSLRQRWDFFVQYFWAFAGLSVSMGLVFLIPGLNFFLFPAVVAGASDIIMIPGQGKA